MDKKFCRSCGIEKDTSEFNKNKLKKDGLQTCCRTCSQKRNYDSYRNSPKRRAKIRENNNKSREENLRYVFNYLTNHPCVDCGNSNPIVLEFDHVRGEKKIEIANMIRHSYSITSLIKEIEKCEIRCANCHRIKTALASKHPWKKMTLAGLVSPERIELSLKD